MKCSKIHGAAAILVIVSFVLAAYFYSVLPATIPSHWNAEGVADGFSGKYTLFIFPIISIALLALFHFLPKFDPLKPKDHSLDRAYNILQVGMTAFILCIQVSAIAFNYYVFNFTYLMVPLLAALFYGIGIAIKDVGRNWFLGIRTPWTISSDNVWKKTHALGSRLFKAIAVLSLASLLWAEKSIFIVIALILIATAYLFYYSYAEWKKEGKQKKEKKK